jgi:hypothetical protein
MTTQICPTCETRFIDGVHYWSGTGKRGNPKDLAGLVCNNMSSGRPCINPCQGQIGGDTWAKRAGVVDGMDNEISRVLGVEGLSAVT